MIIFLKTKKEEQKMKKPSIRDEIIDRLDRTHKHPKATSHNQPQSVRKLRKEEDPDPYRNVFEVDIGRITDSKAFRRLKHKTQIIWAPKDAHIRTRLTHTEEVVNIAKTISRIVGLNEDLTVAIAKGHDIGHPPFGHSGERALNNYIQTKIDKNKSFNHHEQAIKILQEKAKLETSDGPLRGLNLTDQVIDGIRNCSYSSNPQTFEARVVCIVDDLAFALYDYEELLREKDALIPNGYVKTMASLGRTKKERLDRAIKNVIANSTDSKLKMGEDLEDAIEEIRKYEGEIFVSADSWTRHEKGTWIIIEALMDYLLLTDLNIIEKAIQNLIHREEEISFIKEIREGKGTREEITITYVAYMTDTFALDLYRHLFSPETLNYYF